MRNSILAIVLFAVSGVGAAAEVAITFNESEKFTDIRPTNETRNRYQERVEQAFTRFFQDFAAKVPEGYQWQVSINDIDLAGDIDYFVGNAGQALRIIKDIHSPAIRFTHSLRDGYGEEVLSGEVKLRDMGFLQRLSHTGPRDAFEYEQKMLEDWFAKTVQPAVTQHAAVAPKVSN